MSNDEKTPPDRSRREPQIDSRTDDTGKIRLVAHEEAAEIAKDMVPRSEVNGFFTSAEKYFQRAKVILTITVAIGGVGWGFGLWVSSVARKADIAQIEARIDALELQLVKIKERIKRAPKPEGEEQ